MLVAVRGVPDVRLAREHGHVPAGQSEDDRERLEGEDRADDECRLQARTQQGQDYVDRPEDPTRPKDVRRFEEVARYELKPGDEDQQDDRRRAPGFRDHDRREDAGQVLERQEEDRLLDEAGGLQRAVEVAAFREYGQPEDPRREAGDRERDRVDVEEEPVPSKTRVDQQGHDQREHDLQGHDQDQQQQGVPPGVAEADVARHSFEILEREAAALGDHGEDERLDHRDDDEEREERDGREEERERQQSLRADAHPPPPRSFHLARAAP